MSKAWERRPVRYPLLQQDPHCLTLSPCALLCCSPVSPPPSPASEVPAPAPVAAEDEAAESNDAASLAPAPAPESAGFVMQESLTTGTEQAGQDIALAVPEPVDAPAASSAATASSGQVRRRGLGLVPVRGRDGLMPCGTRPGRGCFRDILSFQRTLLANFLCRWTCNCPPSGVCCRPGPCWPLHWRHWRQPCSHSSSGSQDHRLRTCFPLFFSSLILFS